MRVPAWEGDWHARLKARLQECGFDTATAFVDTQPTASLISLTRQHLGRNKDVAAIQLQWMLIDEAEESGTIERCARSLLVRELHEELPEGWHTEWVDDGTPSGSAFRRAGVYASWSTALSKRHEQSSDRVWDALLALPIPEGWLPAGPDDPILLEVFKHWNEPA